MRMMKLAILAVVCGVLTMGAASADTVPPFKGNDTGGIIAYASVPRADIRPLAAAHCAQYNKAAKILAIQAYYGGYASFACRWVRYGSIDRPLRTRY